MELFDGQLLAEIPDSFREMDGDRMAMMYPYEEKPQVILEDVKKARTCTFSLLKEQKLESPQAECAASAIRKVVAGLYPACRPGKLQIIEGRNGKCGWFSFHTADGEGYQVMYVFPVNGAMMLGTMGCAAEDVHGKIQMHGIMKSLEAVRKRTNRVIQSARPVTGRTAGKGKYI